jgi:Tfp pilus assembly protein PilO
MKVKLLLPPLVIVICIGLMVWFVYPAYTNDVDGIKEKRQQLAEENKKLAEVKEKVANISRLAAQLESEKENRPTIMSFVPDSRKEEEIMDNLNFISGNGGLSVVGLNIKPISKEAVVPNPTPTNPVEAVPEVVKPSDFAAELTVVGSYENIKNMLEKVYRLERFNAVKIATIEKAEVQSEGKNVSTATDSLRATISLNFNLLRKQGRVIAITDPAFSLSSFDMSVAKTIREKKSVEILPMIIDQAGRVNPFIPQ